MFWILLGFAVYLYLAHFVSYTLEKKRIVESQKWDLNICCGKTDGGGINMDIFKHQDLPNFKLLDDIYNLPFSQNQFGSVLCSHTIEHVDNPEAFFNELQRVDEQVTIVIPPLYDLAAVFNILEHRYIFLTFKKEHNTLPRHIKLPFAAELQSKMGQMNNA